MLTYPHPMSRSEKRYIAFFRETRHLVPGACLWAVDVFQ